MKAILSRSEWTTLSELLVGFSDAHESPDPAGRLILSVLFDVQKRVERRATSAGYLHVKRQAKVPMSLTRTEALGLNVYIATTGVMHPAWVNSFVFEQNMLQRLRDQIHQAYMT